MGTGLNASKANAYAAVSPPIGLAVSKALAYAVLGPAPVLPSGGWLVTYELSGSPATGNYVDRTSYLYQDESQHSFTQQIRQRGKASFRLRVNAGDPFSVSIFEPIFLFDRNAAGYQLVFSGIIQDFRNQWYNGTAGDHFIEVNAVSLEALFDEVYVSQPMLFTSQTCGAIVTALFNAFQTGAMVTLGTIQAGVTIPQFVANKGDKLSDLFSQLATTSLFTWNVNPATLQLFFGLPTANPAPFSLTNTNALYGTVDQGVDGADFRNRQAVKLSYDAFPHSQEYFVGAGQQNITLMRPVNQIVHGYITLSTCGTATLTFSGQPSAGDTLTIGPLAQGWQASHAYGTGGQIVDNAGDVQQINTLGSPPNSGTFYPFTAASEVTGAITVDGNNTWICRGPSGLATGISQFTFVTAAQLDNTQYGQIVIQSTLAATVQAVADATNANAATRGVSFSLPTWENSQVNAINITGTTLVAQQKAAGSGWIASLSASSANFSWSSATTTGGTSPQGSVGPNEPATIDIQSYVVGTSTAAPGVQYTVGSASIRLATPLNAGTNLNIEYTRADGNIIEVENTSLVTSLALTTGGTGKQQRITDQSSTGVISTSSAAGLQLAQQALAAFDVAPTELDVALLIPGIQAGMVVTLAFGGALGAAVNGNYYIESLKADLIPLDSIVQKYLDSVSVPGAGHYKYTAHLININQIGSDLDFWQGLGGGGSGGSGTGGALVATSGGSVATQGSQAGGTLALEVNGTPSSSQALLNLESGTGVTVTDAGSGAIQISLPAFGPGAGTYTVGAKLTLTGNPGTITVDAEGRITAISQAT